MGIVQPKRATFGIGILASDFLKTEEVDGKSGRWVCTELLVTGGDELDDQQQSQSDSLGRSWAESSTSTLGYKYVRLNGSIMNYVSVLLY